MLVALERYGVVGQPLWPVVPNSLYDAFLAQEETDVRVLVTSPSTPVCTAGGQCCPRRRTSSEWR